MYLYCCGRFERLLVAQHGVLLVLGRRMNIALHDPNRVVSKNRGQSREIYTRLRHTSCKRVPQIVKNEVQLQTLCESVVTNPVVRTVQAPDVSPWVPLGRKDPGRITAHARCENLLALRCEIQRPASGRCLAGCHTEFCALQ